MAFSEPKLKLHTPNWLTHFGHLAHHSLSKKSLILRYQQEAQQIVALLEQSSPSGLEVLTRQRALFLTQAKKNRLQKDRLSLLQSLAWLSQLSQHTLGMTPYPIQLACALAMIDGYLVQLAPGEGKTLTLGLVSSVLGWSGKPCHVITANDYLAKRDAELLMPFFAAQGLSVQAVEQEMSPDAKKQAYACDVVYGTAKQMLADYLSDVIQFGGLASRLRLDLAQIQGGSVSFMMRGLYAVIVDEADSILIDDATTPLIISSPTPNPLLAQAVVLAKEWVDQMNAGEDYIASDEDWEIKFTAKGEQKLEQAQQHFPALWHHWGRLEDLMIQAVLARDKFKLDEHFVIVEGKVVLVDEATGRMMHGRSWSYGLHQAVEIRAGVEMTDPSKTLEKMSFQNFFQSYHHLTGASGTLQNIQAELFHTYRVKTLEMPTRKPSLLAVSPFQSFVSKSQKIEYLLSLIAEIHQQGQPILIGTRRIKDSEELSEHLEAAGFVFEVLNAKRLDAEAQIIAQAGQAYKITLATNMAGRGTDIAVAEAQLALGGLCVIMFEPHESARIDWQLFGRSGRQGNPGKAVPLVSLEDHLLSLHLPWWYRPLLWMVKKSWVSSVSLTTFLVKKSQQNAQNKAFKKRKLLTKMGRLSQEKLSFVKNKTQLTP